MSTPAALRTPPSRAQHLQPGRAGSAALPVTAPPFALDEDGPLAQGREFVWSDADFSRIKALIYKKAGITNPPPSS